MNKENYSSQSSDNTKPDKQRALVLQGGGALGAYEVGVLKTLYKKLTQEDKKNGQEDRLLFDIIAGTSIGAMNGAVLVSQFLLEKEKLESDETKDSMRVCWEKAINELERFWKEGVALKEGTESHHDVPPLKMFPTFSWWAPWTKESPSWAQYTKEKWANERSHVGKNINTEDLASEEAARRYYSTKVFVAGAKKVFSYKDTRNDDKFFDEDNPLAQWIMLNDEPLQKQIETFGNFPIATRLDEGEPRLLVTAVDIAEGTTVTFDSYKKSDGKRKTVYYPGAKYGHKKRRWIQE
jgi:NTE family protein